MQNIQKIRQSHDCLYFNIAFELYEYFHVLAYKDLFFSKYFKSLLLKYINILKFFNFYYLVLYLNIFLFIFKIE